MTTRGFLLPYYYVYSFIRRLSRSTASDDFREWRTQLALLWIEGQLVVCAIGLIWRNAFDYLHPLLAAAIVVLPLAHMNDRLLANAGRVRRYTGEISKWPTGKRRFADVCVVLLIVVTVAGPVALFSWPISKCIIDIPDDFNLYAYVYNDPLNAVDPRGEAAELHWIAPNKVTLTVRYTVNRQAAQPPFTRQQVQAAVASHYSGTTKVNGVDVQITAQAIPMSDPKGHQLNTITVLPTTAGVTASGRAETNKIGGDKITVGAAQDTATTVSHELGHAAGAGDQYKGGVDVSGKVLPADVPGPNNIMHDLSGAKANQQTLQEVLKSPTNANTCAKGVGAANGGC